MKSYLLKKLVYICIIVCSLRINAQQINVTHSSGSADGNVYVTVDDLTELTGDDYEVSFHTQAQIRNENGDWVPGGTVMRKNMGPNDPDTLTGSSIEIFAIYPATPSMPIELQFYYNYVSVDYNFTDGIELDIQPGITIVDFPSFEAGGGIIDPVITGDPSIGYHIEMGDVTGVLSGDGIFHGGEEWIINVELFDAPKNVDWVCWDDGWSGGYLNAEGTTTIEEIGYAERLAKLWNLLDVTTSELVLEDISIVNGIDLFPPRDDVPTLVPNPIIDGFQINVDVSYDDPTTIKTVEVNGTELNYSSNDVWWYGDNFIVCDFTRFGYDNGYAGTSLPLYGGAGGTLDIDQLQKDYELRWTGVLADIVINDSTLTITQSGGSIVTLFGATGYDLADHPLNPNPGVEESFTVRVPFEVWNVDDDQQVNLVFWDRSGNPTINGGAVWNQTNREYLWVVNTPYSPNLIDVTSQVVAINATWNLAIYLSTFTIGDVVKINYNNPARPVVDKFIFSTFSYPSQIIHDEDYGFSGYTETIYYKMIGIPGMNDKLIADYIPGSPGKEGDWRAFWDQGSGNYLEYDSSSTFKFSPGRAFWLLSKNPISITGTVNSVTLDEDFMYSIPIHYEWNLISNPFDKTISWSDVQLVNDVNDPIWFYQSGNYSGVPELKQYEGYYIYNDSSGLTSLRIPYVSPGGSPLNKQRIEISKALEIALTIDGERKSGITIGFSEEARVGKDKLDIFSPPSTFCIVDLALYNENLATNYKYLNKEYRGEIGEGQEFEMKLKNTTGKTVELRAEGIEDFSEYEVYLLDRRLNKLYNLREQNIVEVKRTVKSGEFSLLIGTENYILEKKESLLPGDYVLYQNYPNPFNPITTIRFAIPKDEIVNLKVYNILGELVKEVIKTQEYEAGYYEVELDGRSLSSGVYIYKLEAGSFMETKKMILLR